jgi:hypothetical protein
MAGHPEVLTQSLIALLPSGRPVRVIARYEARDPLVLRFAFARGPEWLFSRDLLIEALEQGSAGVGDVQFHTDGSCVECLWLVLDNGSDHTELLFAVDELTELAARIDHLVPGDGCPIDWDAERRTLAEWGL